jgi:ribosome production factor 2
MTKAPKVIEFVKTALIIKGSKTSGVINQLLTELYMLKKPDAIKMKRNNEIRPFEAHQSLEFFSDKNDASLFAFGCHQKKRPHTLILGRTFDYRLLDMVELGVENFKSMTEFKAKSALGFKPCMTFIGDEFENNVDYKNLKLLLLDFFRGKLVNQLNLAGMEHLLAFTAAAGKVYFRSYHVLMKKSGTKIPRVELEEMGPSMDLVMRRFRWADEDMMKAALRVPDQLREKRQKNITKNALQQTFGTVHMQKQDFKSIATKKTRAMPRKRRSEPSDNAEKKPKQE